MIYFLLNVDFCGIVAEVLLDMVASGGELGWLTWPDQNGVRNTDLT